MLNSENNKLDIYLINQLYSYVYLRNQLSINYCGYIYKYIISNRDFNNNNIEDYFAFLYTISYDSFNDIFIYYYIDAKLVEDGLLLTNLETVPHSNYLFFNKTYLTNNKHSIVSLLDNIIKGIKNSSCITDISKLNDIKYLLNMIILQA